MIQTKKIILYKIILVCFLIALLFSSITAVNSFSSKGSIGDAYPRYNSEKKKIVANINSSHKIQYEFIASKELDVKPEIIGMYGSFNSKVGKDEIYFNISSLVKLNSCVLQYNYSLNGVFEGPFTYNMELINETYFNKRYYSFWHTIINLPILPENKEYVLIVYECVLLTDIIGNSYKINLAPNEITLTIKSYMLIYFPMILLVTTFAIIILIGGTIILYKKGVIFR